MKIKLFALFVLLLLATLASTCLQPTVTATNTTTAQTEWFFVVIETRVHAKNVETDSDHPEERRWYISNVAALPENIASYSAPKKVNEYFDTNVVAPAEKRGVVIEYYDNESQINGGSVIAIETRAQAEEMRKKDLEDRKEQGGNIYSFNIVFGPAKGEETSQPALVFRNKTQPNYDPPRKP
jgi:hypothetical protein